MVDEAYVERKKLTFEQAEGLEPLPTQLQTKQVSEKMRSLLWFVVYRSMNDSVEYPSIGGRSFLRDPWKDIMNTHAIFVQHQMADDVDNTAKKAMENAKKHFAVGSYSELLGFVQFILRHKKCPHNLSHNINYALEKSHSAYRVFDSDTIVPIASDAEEQTLKRAFADLNSTEFRGARNHLRQAGSLLTEGEFAESVRESIHSVESVARVITSSGALGEALSALEKSNIIHSALKKGFGAIYGYTSDEKGIRHPLIDEPTSKVDEIDALFMVGACASFVSYMISKARVAGIFT